MVYMKAYDLRDEMRTNLMIRALGKSCTADSVHAMLGTVRISDGAGLTVPINRRQPTAFGTQHFTGSVRVLVREAPGPDAPWAAAQYFAGPAADTGFMLLRIHCCTCALVCTLLTMCTWSYCPNSDSLAPAASLLQVENARARY